MSQGNADQGPMRLLFEIERDGNPRLYDDLARFKKGSRRVNRLRFLAHEGLLAQNWLLVAPSSVRVPAPIAAPADPDARPEVSGQILQAFDAPTGSAED